MPDVVLQQRCRGANATSWAPPALLRTAAPKELQPPPQECLTQDQREPSFMRLPAAPSLPRSYSTFAGHSQLTSSLSDYVAGRGLPAPHHATFPAAAVPPPLSVHLSRRPVAGVEVLRPANRDSSIASLEGDEVEYSEPREDLQGLLEYFEGLAQQGVRLTEVTYVVNKWSLGGVIPLWHHGFILQAEDEGFLTLDFSRRGILWDTFDTYPDLPEDTIFMKKYCINTDPKSMKYYCEETKPFSWHSHDCQHWARGVMRVMCIMEDPLQDRGGFRAPESDCFLCGKTLERRVLPTCLQ